LLCEQIYIHKDLCFHDYEGILRSDFDIEKTE